VPTKIATAAAIAPITIYCSKLPAIFNRIIATTFIPRTIWTGFWGITFPTFLGQTFTISTFDLKHGYYILLFIKNIISVVIQSTAAF